MSTVAPNAPTTGAPTTSAPTQQSSTGKSVLQDILDKPIVYTPFMGASEITLSARMVLKFLVKPTRSGKMPSTEDAVKFAKLCEARGLNPWEGDAFLVGYDTQDGPEFNLITAHQAFLKRAEVHPEFDGMESGVTIESQGELFDRPGDFVGDGEKLVAGWARVHFKTRKVPSYQRIKLSTFDTGRSRWKKDPAGMISKVAEANALRTAFPTRLGGMYLRDEIASIDGAESVPSIPQQNRTKVRSSGLNETLGRRTAAQPDQGSAGDQGHSNGNSGNVGGNGNSQRQTSPPQSREPVDTLPESGEAREPGDEVGGETSSAGDGDFKLGPLAIQHEEGLHQAAGNEIELKQLRMNIKGDHELKKLSDQECGHLLGIVKFMLMECEQK